MSTTDRLYYLDNLRTFLIFLVVLVHAGVVYESSGIMAPYWIVDDPSTSDLPGLVNLILDLFVMPTIFFISGYFTPQSLERIPDEDAVAPDSAADLALFEQRLGRVLERLKLETWYPAGCDGVALDSTASIIGDRAVDADAMDWEWP